MGIHSVQKIIFEPGTKIFKINSSFMLCFAFWHFLLYCQSMSVNLGVFYHVKRGAHALKIFIVKFLYRVSPTPEYDANCIIRIFYNCRLSGYLCQRFFGFEPGARRAIICNLFKIKIVKYSYNWSYNYWDIL